MGQPQRSDIAPGLLIAEGVELPADVEIGCNVVIHAGCKIGPTVVIQDGAVIGKTTHLGPLSSAPRDVASTTTIGEGAVILAGAVIFAGASLDRETIAGDQCHVRERAVVGAGSIIGRGSAIDNDVTIGAGVRIHTNCYITGHTVIEDHAFVGPGVVTTNDNTMARQPIEAPLEPPRLGRACRIGGGVVICPGVQIGSEAFVAAGAVVAKDVPPRAVVMGVPARQVGEIPEQDLIEHWL